MSDSCKIVINQFTGSTSLSDRLIVDNRLRITDNRSQSLSFKQWDAIYDNRWTQTVNNHQKQIVFSSILLIGRISISSKI